MTDVIILCHMLVIYILYISVFKLISSLEKSNKSLDFVSLHIHDREILILNNI